MDREKVRLPEQVLLRDQRCAAGARLLLGQILAPGDQLHTDCLADLANLAAELSEAEQPERLPRKLNAERRLPRHALLHAIVLVADLARELEHDADRQLRGRLPGRTRAAHRDAALRRIVEVDRSIARA